MQGDYLKKNYSRRFIISFIFCTLKMKFIRKKEKLLLIFQIALAHTSYYLIIVYIYIVVIRETKLKGRD